MGGVKTGKMKINIKDKSGIIEEKRKEKFSGEI